MLPARYLDEHRQRRIPGRSRSSTARPRPAVRPRRAARPLSRTAYLALWAFAVLVAFTVTCRHAAITRLGYEIGRLEAELGAIRRENGERGMAVASLGSPARIQQLAESRLGMVVAGEPVVVLSMKSEQTAVPLPPGQPPSGQEGSPSLMVRIWRLVQRLAGVPAEAAVPGL